MQSMCSTAELQSWARKENFCLMDIELQDQKILDNISHEMNILQFTESDIKNAGLGPEK